MITYIMMICICMLLLWISVIFIHNSIISPANLVILSISIGLVFAAIGVSSWNPISSLSMRVSIILIVGLISWIVGSLFIKVTTARQRVTANRIEKWKLYYAENRKILAMAIVSACCSILWYIAVAKSVGTFSPSEITSAFKIPNNNIETNLSSMMRAYCMASCSLACAYIAIKSRKKMNLISLIYGIILFVSGAIPPAIHALRTDLFHIIAGLIVGIIFLRQLHNYNRDILKKIFIIVVLLIALPVIVQCFYGLVAVMNRSNSNGIDNPWQYFAFYLGSGIPGLSIWLQSWSSNGVGKFEQLANSLQVLLDNIGVIDGHGGSAAEQWLYIDGPANVGNNVNLTTIFGPAYHDFGIIGVVLVALIQSIIISYIFEKANTCYNELAFVCYTSLCYLTIEAMRDDFFSYWLGTMGISTLLLLILQYLILIHNVTAVSTEFDE